MISIATGGAEFPAPIPIVINDMSGDRAHKSDFSLVTVDVGAVLTVTGTVDIPDRVFSLPLKWRGAWVLFAATVANGVFEVRLKFDESGVAVLDEDCVNKDLPYPVFSVPTVQVDVLTVV